MHVLIWLALGSATMNQLYHPAHTAAFFTLLAQNSDIPVFTITNNVVHDLTTFADAEKKHKTLDGVTRFLASNGCLYNKMKIDSAFSEILSFAVAFLGSNLLFDRVNGLFIGTIAKAHYESRYNPPRKAFDFYSAAALVRHMLSKDLLGLPKRQLFYNEGYGLTLVSKDDTWDLTLTSYVSHINTTPEPEDSDFIKTKKEYFQREISIVQSIPQLHKLEVCSIFAVEPWS